MGWSTEPRPASFKHWIDKMYTYETESCSYRLLDYALKNMRVVYSVVEVRNKQTGLVQIIPDVMLVKFFRRRSDWDAESFGYKGVGVDDYYVQCPKRLLERLPPQSNARIAKWVEACWNWHLNSAGRMKMVRGTVFTVPNAIPFRGGYSEQYFQVIKGFKVRSLRAGFTTTLPRRLLTGARALTVSEALPPWFSPDMRLDSAWDEMNKRPLYLLHGNSGELCLCSSDPRAVKAVEEYRSKSTQRSGELPANTKAQDQLSLF